MNVRGNKSFLVFSIITIIWVMFIFSFSMQSGEESHQTSGGIVAMVIDILFPHDFAYVEQLEFCLRKLAHFTEYFVLGILVYLTIRQTTCSKQMLVSMFICIAVASCDETIQLFSGGRSGKIADVLLDSIGALCGCQMNSIWNRFIGSTKR